MPASVSAITSALEALTFKAQSAQGPSNQINIINMALAVSGLGPIPVVIARLSDIITTYTSTIPAIDSTKAFAEKADQDLIFKSFSTLVQVQTALLNILIGKAGVATNLLPFVGPPLAAALRQLESVFDTLAFELLDAAPDVDIKGQKDAQDVTLDQAIQAWQSTPQV